VHAARDARMQEPGFTSHPWRAAPWRLAALCACLAACLAACRAQAQVRGVYPLGMSAIGSGALPASGVSYSNLLLFYARDRLTGPGGELVSTGHNSVILQMNTIAWATDSAVLAGARYSLTATIPIASNSLASDAEGARSGGGGLGDSFYQPVMLGWTAARADLKIAYGFLAPTGRFTAGAADNVGSGYWTHTLSAGQTVYLTKSRATALSAFQMYELHGEQESTDVRPGETFDLDYSLSHVVRLRAGLHLQPAVVGYSQWQTSATRGPDVTTAEAAARYRVHALGVATNLLLPDRKIAVGVRWFDELWSRSTLQGYSVQLTTTIAF
jgi:hypothetical protein